MSALPWLRLYTEIIDDEKLGLLAFEDRWHYIALLCLKGKGVLDGEPDKTLLDRKVALKLGLTLTELEKAISRLASVRLIDKETYQPLSWDVRQKQSDTDPTAAQRKARQRQRERDMSRVTTVTVTRTEEDTDTDKEKDSAEAPSYSKATKQTTLLAYIEQCKAAGAKPIPDDHYIRQYMTDAGIAREMGEVAWLRFREEHTTGSRRGKRYKDWPATFANSVKDRWYKLWYVNADGEATWSNEGMQAKRALDARRNDA